MTCQTAHAAGPSAGQRIGDAPFDLSIILNIHDETKYLARTLRSCDAAARYARAGGARCEMIMVLDRPSFDAAHFVGGWDFSAYEAHQIVLVDHGSLGPARNSGIQHARGAYITTCDADDLISFNCFAEMLAVAAQSGPRAILVPQYLLMFGAEYCMVEYFENSIITPMMFTGYQPYHSRLFAARDLFRAVGYVAAHPGSGYVYEDWHFNCEALAHGAYFVVVPETVLFCRRRRQSLLTRSNQVAAPQIPPSRMFAPRTYLALCGPAMAEYRARGGPPPALAELARERQGGSAAVLADPVIALLTQEAADIDPAIDAVRLAASPFWTNLGNPLTPGLAYFALCERAGEMPFSDLFLLPPALEPGQFEYLRAVLTGCRMVRPAGRCLALVWGGPVPGRDVRDLFADAPVDLVYADLHAIEPGLQPHEIEQVLVKALQSLAGAARLHLWPGAAVMAFFAKFQTMLADRQVLLHRLPDISRTLEDVPVTDGAVFEFVSACFEGFSAILVPDAATAHADRARLAMAPERWITLPALPVNPGPIQRRLLCLPQDDPSLATAILDRLADMPPIPELDMAEDWNEFATYELSRYDFVLAMTADGPAQAWLNRALVRGVPVMVPRAAKLAPEQDEGVTRFADAAAVPGLVRRFYEADGPLPALRAAVGQWTRAQGGETAFLQALTSALEKAG